MTIDAWLVSAAQKLHDTPSPRLDAELIAMHVLKKTKTWLVAHGDTRLTNEQQHTLEELLRRRENREPVAYLTGVKEFYGRKFEVNADVLIPRPETEDIVELAKKYLPKSSDSQVTTVLDIGTGSGCLGLSIALETGAQVTLSDISEAALGVAQNNAVKLGVKTVRFVPSNVLSAFLQPSYGQKTFDMIVANLPYVDRAWTDISPELTYEPATALYAEDSGLALIKQLVNQAPSLLASKGYLLLEADPTQHTQIVEHAKNFRLVKKQGYGVVLAVR